MKSSVTNSFRKQLEQLPKSVQEQADKAYALWQTGVIKSEMGEIK